MTKQEQKSRRTQAKAFVVTKKGDEYDLVPWSVLEKYSIKEDNTSGDKIPQSKDISDEDNFDYQKFKKPQFDLRQLCDLLDYNTYHRRCCEVVAQDASGYEYNIEPIDSDEDNTESFLDQKEFIEQFIQNLYTPINTTLYRFCYDKRAMGCAAIEVLREGDSNSAISDLRHITVYNMRLHRDGVRILQREGTRKRWFILYGKNYTPDGVPFDVNCDTGEMVEYGSLKPSERANEIIWGQDYSPHNIDYGSAKVIPLIKVIYGDLSRDRYNQSFFENYGMPSYAVTVTGDFDAGPQPGDPDYVYEQTFEYQIKQQLQNVVDQPYSSVILMIPSIEGDVGVNLQPLNIGSGGEEAGFRLFRADNRDEILAGHGVPPYRIGISVEGSLGGNVSSESSVIYTTSIIQPIKKMNEDLLNNLFYTEYVHQKRINKEPYVVSGKYLNWVFKIAEIDKRDYQQDLYNAKELFQMGAITPRQITETLGKPFKAFADPNNPLLDEYYVNGVPMKNLFMNDGTEPMSNTTYDDTLKINTTTKRKNKEASAEEIPSTEIQTE